MKPDQLHIQSKEKVVDNPNQQGISVDKTEVRKMIEAAFAIEKPAMLEKARHEAKVEIDKQIQTSQASFITVFGIFASITSFLTIEFQFLKTLDNCLQILGFTLVLFALLFGFNIALDYLIKSRFDNETSVPSFWFSFFVMILLGVGIFLTFIGSIPNGVALFFS